MTLVSHHIIRQTEMNSPVSIFGLRTATVPTDNNVVISEQLEARLKTATQTSGVDNLRDPDDPTKPKFLIDRREYTAARHKILRQKQMLPEAEIESIVYGHYSPEEIDSLAVVNCNNPEKDGIGSARDLAMGPQNNNQLCATCFSTIDDCPGHHGKIEVPPIYSPLVLQTCIYVLTITCHSCGGLLVSDDEIQANKMAGLQGHRKLVALYNYVLKTTPRCRRIVEIRGQKSTCSGKDMPIPIYLSLTDAHQKNNNVLLYKYGTSGQNYPTTASKALEIFDQISNEDAIKMGFKGSVENPKVPISHPRNLIVTRILVMPTNARPDLMSGDKPFPSDFTNIYIDLIRLKLDYDKPTNTADDRTSILQTLWFKYRNLIKARPQGSGAKKETSDIHKSINGKKGLIRANIMGKRVGSAGRTVVGPGYNIRVDQLAVPFEMARKLTHPINVTVYNRDDAQKLYDNGQVVFITPAFGKNAGQKINVAGLHTTQKYEIRVGDKIERYLQDGDPVIVNRQPSLRRQSMIGLKAKIIPERIMRINLSITTPLNADFDGDETNMHVPQTVEAIAETAITVGVANNLINEENNRPMIAIVYDGLTSAYMLTYDKIEAQLKQECSYIKQRMQFGLIPRDRSDETIDAEYNKKIKEHKQRKNNADVDYFKLQDDIVQALDDNADIQPLVEKQKELEELIGLLDPLVFQNCMNVLSDRDQYKTLRARAQRHQVPWQTGRLVFSAALPEDFYYVFGGVVIVDGILKRGTIDSSVIGHGENSMLLEMNRQYDGQTVVDFQSDLQFILNQYFDQVSFSVGYDDLVPSNYSEYLDLIAQRKEKAEVKAMQLYSEPKKHKIEQDKRERNILNALNIVKDTADTLTSASTNPVKNGFMVMNKSGAKGSNVNFAQISAILAQQMISGYRIPADLPGGRSLPIFEPGDSDPRNRGFVNKSYLTGLDGPGAFHHSTSTREGITDTALGTAKSGTVSHILGKVLEDIHISDYGSAETADGTVIEYVYGGDGLDPGHVSRMRIRNHVGAEDNKRALALFFRDFDQVAGKLNAKYGINPY